MGGGGGASAEEEGPLLDLWLPFLGGEVSARRGVGGWGFRSVHGVNDD